MQGVGPPRQAEGLALQAQAAPERNETGQEQPLQQLPQRPPQRLPPRRAKPGRADGQAVLKGMRLLMTGSHSAARVEAERVASSMGATILNLDQVLHSIMTFAMTIKVLAERMPSTPGSDSSYRSLAAG